MTTTFFLVRHAAHDRVGTVLCGRMPGVRLGEVGRAQARAPGRALRERDRRVRADEPARARAETAEPIAARLGQTVERSEALLEIDFGAWTGSPSRSSTSDPRWAAWNRPARSTARRTARRMLEAQARIVARHGAPAQACTASRRWCW